MMFVTHEQNQNAQISSINSSHFSGIVDPKIFSPHRDPTLFLLTSKKRTANSTIDFFQQIENKFLRLNTRWNKREKKRLYRALPRFGRNDIHRIAQSVQTKNIVQIQHYLYLLETLAKGKFCLFSV
jgi:hypothetical protein